MNAVIWIKGGAKLEVRFADEDEFDGIMLALDEGHEDGFVNIGSWNCHVNGNQQRFVVRLRSIEAIKVYAA